MKLKRLITAMILVISVAAAAAIFTGCGDPVENKEEAIAMLQAASDKTNEFTAYSIKVEVKELDGSRRSEATYKLKGNEFSMTNTSFAAGEDDKEGSQYYKDGYLYMDNGEDKYKMAYSLEDFSEYMFGMTSLFDDEFFDELRDDEVWTFSGKYKGGKDVFTFESDEETYIIKLDKKGRLSYMYLLNESREIEMKINFSSPKITFPDDLDTYNEQVG